MMNDTIGLEEALGLRLDHVRHGHVMRGNWIIIHIMTGLLILLYIDKEVIDCICSADH